MKNYNDKEFLNIGSGEDISIKDLAFKTKKAVGYKGSLIFDKTRPDGMHRKLLDTSKIKKLGWRHQTDLEEGVVKTYDWFLKNEIKM